MARNLTIINSLDESRFSYTIADVAAAASTLSVRNISGFATNQILLVGDWGNEATEIIKSHPSTLPSGSTITLASALAQSHPSGTKITVLDYDTALFYHASTASGAKTLLATVALRPDHSETDYTDSTHDSGYFFVRYSNSITGAVSEYSEPIPFTGYTDNTARRLIDSALSQMNEKDSDSYPDDYGFDMINACQEEVLRERKRWSWMQQFGADVGTIATGVNAYALPTDIDNSDTNKSVLMLKVAGRRPMIWVDQDEWNRITAQARHTTLASAIIANDSTITLTDSSDFDESGTVNILGTEYAYTANNQSTGVLTLFENATTPQSNGSQVWQGATMGEPKYYTVNEGYYYVYPVPSSNYNDRSLISDYYTALTSIADDTNTIVVPDNNLVLYYLTWKFILKRKNGEADDQSDYWRKLYQARLDRLAKKEVSNKKVKLKPRFNDFSRKMMWTDDPRNIRLGNDEP